jgi:tRNA A58 N-methylase Trm61
VKLCCVLLFCITAAMGQVADKANRNYKTEGGREAVARGLSDPQRDQRQKPGELVAAMQLRPGMTVADIGTGTGYMLPWLSAAVGPAGTVLAEDIFHDFLAKAKANAQAAGLTNVKFINGSTTDATLAQGSVDAILALDSYHHYDYPERMLASFRRALKPDGKLVIVEYYRSTKAMLDAMNHIRLDAPDLIREVEANRFTLLERRDQIPEVQYMVTFGK